MYFALIASNVSSVTAAPGSLLHRADKDFEVGEYVIPKDATIIAVTRGLMYDPKVSICKAFPHSALWCDSIYLFRVAGL